MSDLGTYQVINQVNKEPLSLCIEWLNSSFKITLLQSIKIPWMGEMTAAEVNFFSEELSKTPKDYLSEAKDIFSGKDPEVQFSFKNDIFVWKKGIWILGKIKMQLISNLETISDILHKTLNHHYIITKDLYKTQAENEQLLEVKLKLSNNLNQMVEIKNKMEAELYKKFLLLLNTKKEKIRELEKSLEKDSKSAFDAGTDDSNDAWDENNKKEPAVNQSTPTKRKIIGNRKYKKKSRLHKKDDIDNTEVNLDTVSDYAVASTSKNNISEMFNSSKRQSQSSNETDCDIQLNYTDDESSTGLNLHPNEELESEMTFSE